jgi:hypothetical protein
MDVEEAVYAHLTDDAGVIDALGDRLYPAAAPADCDHPYAVYFEAGERFAVNVAGDVMPLGVWDMRLDVYGVTYDSVKAARKALYDALIGVQNEPIADGSVTVRGVFHEASDAGVLVPIHATETGEFRAGLRLSIHAGPTG